MRWKGKTGLMKSYPSRLMPHHVSYDTPQPYAIQGYVYLPESCF